MEKAKHRAGRLQRALSTTENIYKLNLKVIELIREQSIEALGRFWTIFELNIIMYRESFVSCISTYTI